MDAESCYFFQGVAYINLLNELFDMAVKMILIHIFKQKNYQTIGFVVVVVVFFFLVFFRIKNLPVE